MSRNLVRWTVFENRLRAKREAFRETGPVVEAERIVYIQESVEPNYHFCKFHLLCRAYEGDA